MALALELVLLPLEIGGEPIPERAVKALHLECAVVLVLVVLCFVPILARHVQDRLLRFIVQLLAVHAPGPRRGDCRMFRGIRPTGHFVALDLVFGEAAARLAGHLVAFVLRGLRLLPCRGAVPCFARDLRSLADMHVRQGRGVGRIRVPVGPPRARLWLALQVLGRHGGDLAVVALDGNSLRHSPVPKSARRTALLVVPQPIRPRRHSVAHFGGRCHAASRVASFRGLAAVPYALQRFRVPVTTAAESVLQPPPVGCAPDGERFHALLSFGSGTVNLVSCAEQLIAGVTRHRRSIASGMQLRVVYLRVGHCDDRACCEGTLLLFRIVEPAVCLTFQGIGSNVRVTDRVISCRHVEACVAFDTDAFAIAGRSRCVVAVVVERVRRRRALHLLTHVSCLDGSIYDRERHLALIA
eukprot:633149-Rhodomonas_salina.1